VICEKHFEAKYLVKKDKKCKLTAHAVPTVFFRKTIESVERVVIEFDGDDYIGEEAEELSREIEQSQDQEIIAIEAAFINEQAKIDEIRTRCRFCAEIKDEIIDMASFVTYNIEIDNIFRFLNLHVVENDLFPNGVCEECFNQVLQIETFIVKCKGADKWLWEEIGKLRTISVTNKINEPQKPSRIDVNSSGNIKVETLEVDDQMDDAYNELIEECHSETEDGSTIATVSEVTEPTSNNETLPVMNPKCNKFAMKSYSCEVCLVVFAGLKTYQAHICDVPEIRCSECSDVFKTVFDLMKHRKYLHKEDQQKNYCRICKQLITGRSMEFKKHKAKCNKEMNRNIECKICHKVSFTQDLLAVGYSMSLLQIFPSLYTFTVHQMFHGTKKDPEKDALESSKPVKKKAEVICELCGKIYTTIGDCRRHMRLKHMEIKEVFSCDICNKTYPSKSVLKDHFRNTHVVNEVPCTFCGKIFRNKTHLKKHMVYHDDSKKVHKCFICPDQPGFINKASLQRHQTRHANSNERVSYSCEICVNYNFQ
jgi:hypothetical protein